MRLGLRFVAVVIIAIYSTIPSGVAAAGEPQVTCTGGACGSFTTHSSKVVLSTNAGTTVTCSSSSGSGKYTTRTTGEISLTLNFCHTPTFFNTACTSPARISGQIATGAMVFHNVYLTISKVVPGILITQPAIGPIATFTCAGFLHVELSGNVIGRLTSPVCGASSSILELSLNAPAHGQQEYKQVTLTGTKFDLSAKVNGGGAETAAMSTLGSFTFVDTATVSCV